MERYARMTRGRVFGEAPCFSRQSRTNLLSSLKRSTTASHLNIHSPAPFRMYLQRVRTNLSELRTSFLCVLLQIYTSSNPPSVLRTAP